MTGCKVTGLIEQEGSGIKRTLDNNNILSFYQEGVRARYGDTNPYAIGTVGWFLWFQGYHDTLDLKVSEIDNLLSSTKLSLCFGIGMMLAHLEQVGDSGLLQIDQELKLEGRLGNLKTMLREISCAILSQEKASAYGSEASESLGEPEDL